MYIIYICVYTINIMNSWNQFRYDMCDNIYAMYNIYIYNKKIFIYYELYIIYIIHDIIIYRLLHIHNPVKY